MVCSYYEQLKLAKLCIHVDWVGMVELLDECVLLWLIMLGVEMECEIILKYFDHR